MTATADARSAPGEAPAPRAMRARGGLRAALGMLVALVAAVAPSPASHAQQVCANPGQDGKAVLRGVVNTYHPGAGASVPAGSTSIAVGPARGSDRAIAAGDLLLLHQVQDADVASGDDAAYGDGVPGDPATGWTALGAAGRYEFVVAVSAVPYGGGTLQLRGTGPGGGTLFAYRDRDAGPAHGASRYQVVRVPQHSDARVGGGLRAAAWDGRTGGVLALDVAGTLDLAGRTIDLTGHGFRGGGARQLGGGPGGTPQDYARDSALPFHGSKGEGIAGTPRWVFDRFDIAVEPVPLPAGSDGYPGGSHARGAPATAGGGGTDGRPSANDYNSGGGGGANGGDGGRGGNARTSAAEVGGFGGRAFPGAATRLAPGSGGGSGSANDGANGPAAPPGIFSSGGAGGGMALLRVGRLEGAGRIVADGDQGIPAGNDGGGGGGAGGSVLLTVADGAAGGLSVDARGGNGGNAWIVADPGGQPGNRHGPGGGGGGGLVLANVSLPDADVEGGNAGRTTRLKERFGATDGAPGRVERIDPGDVPGVDPGAECEDRALLGVAKSAAVEPPRPGVPARVTFEFVLENFGTVPLVGVSLRDDLAAVFGADAFAVVEAPAIVAADPGAALTPDPAFDGLESDDLLIPAQSSLAPGASATVRVRLDVFVPGSYVNAAVATATDPDGETVADDSTDGDDPDVDDTEPDGTTPDDGAGPNDGNDDPTDNTSGTPVEVPEGASIGIAKDASVTGDGPFEVTLDLYLENFGNVALSNVQVTDDLDATFGAGNYSVSTAPSIVSDPGGGLVPNPDFDGSADTSLLSQTASTLAVGATAQLRVVVTVEAPGSYLNTALAGGDPPSGPDNRVTDVSTDGVDPDANGNDDPDDDDEETPIDLGENASIGIAKDASVSGDGPFEVTLDFYLENFGNVALSNVQVTDDLDATFGAGNYSVSTAPSIVSDPGGGLTPNPEFDGSADTSLLSQTASTLAVGGTAQLRVVVTVEAPGSYLNTALAGGDPPSGPDNRVTDISTDGVDPDANGNDDPDDDDEETPIDLGENASIGIAKDASVTGDGPFEVTLDFYLENFGNVALSNVQVTDDLDATFGAGNYSVSTAPSIVSDPGGGLVPNPEFDGSADTSLLSQTASTLAVGATAQLRVVVTVEAPGSYLNTALAGGDPPSGPDNRVTDISTDGVDPDANGNDDPDDDDEETPIDLGENASIGIAKDASVTGDGLFEVTLDFYLENFGNVALSNVQVTDDLDATFGAGNYAIAAAPSIVSDPGGGLVPNPDFDGSADTSLLSQTASTLAVGATAQLRVVVTVEAPGSYLNTALAGGDPPSGPDNRVTDVSTDGVDPDANGNDDPGDDDEETPIDLGEAPRIGLAKRATLLTQTDDGVAAGNGSHLVVLEFEIRNYGNVPLSRVQIDDDLDATFGAGNYLVPGPPMIADDPGGGLTANPAFDGSGDIGLLVAAESALGNVAPANRARVRVTVEVLSPGSYLNTALAGGDPPSGPDNRVTDVSTDGLEPDANGNGDPGDDDEETPIDIGEAPQIGLAKRASVAGGGPFEVTLDFVLRNSGNVALSGVSLTDDLVATFGAGNFEIAAPPSIVADPGGGLVANAGFDGAADLDLLVAAESSLDAVAPNDRAEVRVVVRVLAPGSYRNVAEAGGDPPSGPDNRVTDVSTDGVEPDADGDGDPGNDDEPTPIDLAERPAIGLAKRAELLPARGGSFPVALEFTLRNYGNVPLANVSLTDDLDATFGAGNYAVAGAPVVVSDPGGGLTPNPGFDGSSDPDLLVAAQSTLGLVPPADSALVRVVVDVFSPGSYSNTALAGGDPPSGPDNRVTDRSTDGVDPDADGDGDPGDDDEETPIDIGEAPAIGLAKRAAVEGTGPFRVTFELRVRNYGNVPLANVSLTDDLVATFGAGNFRVLEAPAVVEDPGGGLVANPAYDGAEDIDLLDAAASTLDDGEPADRALVRVVVEVDAPGSYLNTAIAGGDPPSGPDNRVTDVSTDGVDPDADGDGDPGDDDEETPVDTGLPAGIGLAKAASVMGDGPFLVTFDFTVRNTGQVPLANVQVDDDLVEAFGAGNFEVVAAPEIVSDPGGGLTPNPAWDGDADPGLLLAAASTLGTELPEARIRARVRVFEPGLYLNTALAGGDPPSGPEDRVFDVSTDGLEPDANGNGDPGDDDEETPIDVTSPGGAVLLEKSVERDETTVGQPLGYALTLENLSAVAFAPLVLVDDLPPGFRYLDGSARLTRAGPDNALGTADDVRTPIDPTGADPLRFELATVAPAERLRVDYRLAAGSGVTPGIYENVAVPTDGFAPVGNEARAAVEVVADPLLQRTRILGKVFHDRDGDGWQDPASAGDVRVFVGPPGGEGAFDPPARSVRMRVAGGDWVAAAPGPDGAFRLGDLRAARSALDALDGRAVELELDWPAGADAPPVRVTTREGTRRTARPDGGVVDEPVGSVRRGLDGQDLAVAAQVVERPGRRTLAIRVENRGTAEEGIPGVRLATATGLLVETDAWGRFHIEDVDGGRWERGRNFILKVDPATLPRGHAFTTPNPRVQRITAGLMNTLHFGVRLPEQDVPGEREIERDLGEVFFDYDASSLRPDAREAVSEIAAEAARYGAGRLTVVGHTEDRDLYREPEARDYTLTPRFDVFRTELRPADLAALDRIAADWSGATDVQIEVIGHTDSTRIAPRSRHVFPDNHALSRARAAAVGEYLREKLGLPAGAVYAEGRGADQPVATNETAAGRQLNRRTELRMRGRFPQPPVVDREGASWEYNQALGLRRAETVRDALAPVLPPADYPAEAISRGQDDPRSSNETEEGRQDNRRVDVAGSFRVALPRGGTVWAVEDPAAAEPRLDVTGPPEVVWDGDRPREPVTFRLSTNYPAFLARWKLALYPESDGDRARPVAVLEGEGVRPQQEIVWDGRAAGTRASGRRPAAGDMLAYELTVWDAAGNFDRTETRWLQLTRAPRPGENEAEAREIYGTTRLAQRSIPVRGSRVRVHGADVARGVKLELDGEPVPVDGDGKFAAERILPVGAHRLPVVAVDDRGERWERALDVEVSGRYLFLVGLAELTVGANDLSGDVEPLGPDDRYDGDVFVDGRVALHLKGKVRGKYLITAQLDTTEDELDELWDNVREEDPRRLFRTLDPDRYYPVYGDDSTTIEDAPSQGRMYVRVDWDKSRAMWGNYQTTLTGTELAQYNRTLYGADFRYRSRETTSHGDDRASIRAFASEPQTASGHNVFDATGGSLYYLRDTDIVLGSEKVRVEVLDRDSGRVVENVALERGRDYEIDELQGRLILQRPLTQVADQTAPSIVRDTPLDGNDVRLLVDYEYLPGGFRVGDATVGARVHTWLGDHVALGGTWVDEPRDGADYELQGVDLTLRHAPGTFLHAEYAETESTQVANSFGSADGGLTFGALAPAGPARRGDARGVEARLNLAEVAGTERDAIFGAWWRERDAGYSIARLETGTATAEYGGELVWRPADGVSLAARGTVVDREGVREDRTLSAQAGVELGERWTLGVEGRRVEETPAGGAASAGTLAGVRLGYDVTPRVAVWGSGQVTLEQDDDYRDNDLAAVGVRARLGERASVQAEFGAGDRGDATRVGADFRISDRHTVYGTWTASTDRTDPARNGWTVGQRARISNRLQVFTEDQFLRHESGPGIAHVFGLDFRPVERWRLGASLQSSDAEQATGPDLERDVVSLSAGLFGERTRWSGRLEWREDRGPAETTQWLTTNRFERRAGPSWTWSAKLSLSRTENDATGFDTAQFVETGIGFAYRPVAHERWTALGRWVHLYDLPSAGQRPLRPDQRSHVLSLEAIRRLSPRWKLGAFAAHRRGEVRDDRDAGDWYRADATLLVARARWEPVTAWEGLVEYRWLFSREAEDDKRGALVGVYRALGDHVKLGAGYNFTDFSDDLTDQGYDGGGWFVNVLGKY